MSRDNNWHDMNFAGYDVASGNKCLSIVKLRLGTSRSSRGFRRRIRQAHDILCGKKDAKIVVERGTTAIKALEG